MKIKLNTIYRYKDVTEGKIYDVIEEVENYYIITDDVGDTNDIWKRDCEIVCEENKKQLTIQEVLAYENGTRFKVYVSPIDDIVVKVNRNMDLVVEEFSKAKGLIGESIMRVFTPYGLINAKFEKIESELTIDDFKLGEKFKVIELDNTEYICYKLKIFDEIRVAIRFEGGEIGTRSVNSFKGDNLNDRKLYKLEDK